MPTAPLSFPPSGTRARILAVAVVALLAVAPGCAGTGATLRASPYDLTLADATSGETFDFAQLRGKVVLVTFFATWCLPCMTEVPTLKRLQAQHQAKGFTVVGVGMDLEGPRVLGPFAKVYNTGYPVLVADDAIREGRSAYGRIGQIPTTLLIDRDGKVALAWAGPANPAGLAAEVAKLLQ